MVVAIYCYEMALMIRVIIGLGKASLTQPKSEAVSQPFKFFDQKMAHKYGTQVAG